MIERFTTEINYTESEEINASKAMGIKIGGISSVFVSDVQAVPKLTQFSTRKFIWKIWRIQDEKTQPNSRRGFQSEDRELRRSVWFSRETVPNIRYSIEILLNSRTRWRGNTLRLFDRNLQRETRTRRTLSADIRLQVVQSSDSITVCFLCH